MTHFQAGIHSALLLVVVTQQGLHIKSMLLLMVAQDSKISTPTRLSRCPSVALCRARCRERGCLLQRFQLPQTEAFALLAEREAACLEQAAEANAAVAEARQLADAADSRAQAAEAAKIELSLQLAELAAEVESAADVSGLPSRTTDTAADNLSQADHLHRRWAIFELLVLCIWAAGRIAMCH